MDSVESRQSNYTHALTKLRSGDKGLCGLADPSNFLKTNLWYFEGGKIDYCVWPQLAWWASHDTAYKWKNEQGLSNE